MAPDERSRVEVSQALTEQLGPAAAAALMECIPPFGWHEIATKSDLRTLDARIEGLGARIDGLEEHLGYRFEARMHVEANRLIRWTVATFLGAIAAVSAAAAAAAALLG